MTSRCKRVHGEGMVCWGHPRSSALAAQSMVVAGFGQHTPDFMHSVEGGIWAELGALAG